MSLSRLIHLLLLLLLLLPSLLFVQDLLHVYTLQAIHVLHDLRGQVLSVVLHIFLQLMPRLYIVG